MEHGGDLITTKRLLDRGASQTVEGERELGVQMARYTLRRFGVTSREVEAIAQGLRRRRIHSRRSDRCRSRLGRMAEELRPEEPFGVQGTHEHIWHIAAAERWSDGALVGHRTHCGRNYPPGVERAELAGVDQVCSDCSAQVSRRH